MQSSRAGLTNRSVMGGFVTGLPLVVIELKKTRVPARHQPSLKNRGAGNSKLSLCYSSSTRDPSRCVYRALP